MKLNKELRARKTSGYLLAMAIAMLLSVFAIRPAEAHVIDRIDIKRAGEEAEIQIRFDVRIQYLREASLDDSDIHIYLKLLEADPDMAANRDRTRLVPETLGSPPSDITPHFTASFPELDSSLVISFDEKVAYRVQPGKDGRSISIFTSVIKPKLEPGIEAPAPAARTPQEIEQEALQLMDSARAAISQEKIITAIETLNRLLNLPANQQSRAAQELIGEVREKNGEFDKARIEYELYLKFYPDAPDVAQVKQRLAQLPLPGAKPTARFTAPNKPGDMQMMFYGGLSQTYYKGMSHTDITTADINGVSTESLTATDQSMLVSSLDMTAQKRTDTTDTRLVLRDVNNANFLPGQTSDNRVNTAYIEQSAHDHSYLYRVGRQASSEGGVSGLFDGMWLSFSPNPAWRINGVLGTPVDFYNAPENKVFAGISADLTRLPGQWSGSGYFIEQKVGTIVDRQAIGVEAHYSDAVRNYSALVDYDTLFRTVNTATFQGNWTTDMGINYNLLLDHYKSPPLAITTALQGQTVQSINTLVRSGMSVDALRADAKALSATSNLVMVGMTKPVSAHWRLGGDFRVDNTSGTGAAGMLAARPGSGNIYTYTVQAIANNLFTANDLSVIGASFANAPTFAGRSLQFNRAETLRRNWRLDMSLQLYSESNQWGVDTRRVTPSLKLNYHLNNSLSFEVEGGIEDIRTYSATQNEKTRRKYFYAGYRWDFR